MRPGRISREEVIERAITKVGTKTVWSRINDVDRDSATKKVVFYEREERCSVEGKVRKGANPVFPKKSLSSATTYGLTDAIFRLSDKFGHPVMQVRTLKRTSW